MATTDYDSLSDRFERNERTERKLKDTADVSDKVQERETPDSKPTDGVLDPREKLKRIREVRDQ
jgi:hypothetical protein